MLGESSKNRPKSEISALLPRAGLVAAAAWRHRPCNALTPAFRNRWLGTCLPMQTRQRQVATPEKQQKRGNKVWMFCPVCAAFNAFPLSSLTTQFRCLLPWLKPQRLGTQPKGRDGERARESAWKNLSACLPAANLWLHHKNNRSAAM